MMSEMKVLANPNTVFREEFDDWALLFNPETGTIFGLNPTGAFIRKRMDGSCTIDEIVRLLKDSFKNVPPEVEVDVPAFIAEMVEKGFAEYREQ